MRGDEQMDALIDAALPSYAEPGEIPDARVVAVRVMERARAAERRGRFWWWAVVVPATACLLVALLGTIWTLRGPRVSGIAWTPKAPAVAESRKNLVPQRLKPDSSRSVDGTAQAPPLQNRFVDSGKARVAEAGVPDERRLPKLEVFPTPRPLSPEEQELVAFATETPAKVREQVVEAQKHVSDPIVIADVKIAPLRVAEEQDSNEER